VTVAEVAMDIRELYFEAQHLTMRHMNTTKYKHFTKNDRNELSILLKKGYSYRDIGDALRKSPSSISREVEDNSVNGIYDPDKADHKAYVKRWQSKYQGMKINGNQELENYVRSGLVHYWTPEEIAGRLEYEQGHSVISFKTIYKWLFSPQGQLLCDYLPSKRCYRHRRRGRKNQDKTLIPNKISIELRPETINNRERVGDMEADMLGVPKDSVENLVGVADRKSRYFQARKIGRIKYAINEFKRMSVSLSAVSFTFDNGVENARHEELQIPTYFCHPYSPWEKGTIENTFKRMRRFIPKKSRPDNYSDKEIENICDIMNNTPRKCLGYRTPKEIFEEHHANIYQPIIAECCASG
jgi:IS30 family transposase